MSRKLNIFQMKNLMLEALATKDDTLLPGGGTFNKYGYVGNSYALFALTERLAIQKGIVENNANLTIFAWGSTGENLFEGQNTNFTREEIELMYEAFHLLLQQNIIAPGGYLEGHSLPAFHVTSHGHKCLKQLQFLPYDYDGFLSTIKSIDKIDNWTEYYLTEALKCFNSGCYQATVIMIGLASEKLTLDLIESCTTYLSKNETNLIAFKDLKVKSNFHSNFNNEIMKARQISIKYSIFDKYVRNLNIDSSIKKLLDQAASNGFYQYIRLNRNETSHPNEILKDETETMLLFTSFIKYATIQTQIINLLKK